MKRYNVGILSPSHIVTSGLCSLQEQIKEMALTFLSLNDTDIESQIIKHHLVAIIADPLSKSFHQLVKLRNENEKSKSIPLITISSSLLPNDLSEIIDARLSIYDSPATIIQTIQSLVSSHVNEVEDARTDLTPREKEIVVGIVKGLSNKEIAQEINVSVNTVMTHRRNIASKLQIHSPAGLTIYAIVSKLVSIDDIKYTIN
mgnify:CR=1 FL=1|jgi:transcriptional regulator